MPLIYIVFLLKDRTESRGTIVAVSEVRRGIYFSHCRSPLYLLLRVVTNFFRDSVLLRSVPHKTWAALQALLVKAPSMKANPVTL